MGNKKHLFFNPSLSSKGNIEALIVTFLLFFISNPYFFWQWYGDLLPRIIVTTIIVFYFWKNRRRMTVKDKKLFYFFVFVWLFYSLNELVKGARLGVVATAPYVLLGLVPLVKKDFGKVVFNNFVFLYAIIIGLSMISWILAINGLIPSMGEIGQDNDSMVRQQKSYLVYPLALVSTSNMGDFLRFFGIFDEPGVVGTIGALILCALRFNMKDWRCVIILMSGLLSTSMFFYVLVGVYWLAELIMVRKKFGTFLIIIIGIAVFYVLTKDNDAVSKLVWGRFEWNSSRGTFEGDSRADERSFDMLNRIWASGEIWFGVVDKAKFWEENFGTSSFYNIIGQYGLLFSAMYIFWLILVGYRYRINRWDFMLYIFVVIGCSYQRPGLYNALYIFLYVCIARYKEFFADMIPKAKLTRHLRYASDSRLT